MLNKKIIIILAVILFAASTTLVFFLVKQNDNKAIGDSANSKVINELKNNNPGLSGAQLKFFAETAAKGGIAPCLGRNDAGACVFSVAFIKGNSDFCDSLDHNSNNKELYQACAAGAIKKTADAKLGQCAALSGDDYYNCLGGIFSVYSEKADCAAFAELTARAICEDFFNYKTVYLKYDRELCKIIKDLKINQYCLKNIIDKK